MMAHTVAHRILRMIHAENERSTACTLRGDAYALTIENAFSKLKALMRAKAERTITALWTAVGSLVDLFTPAECQNYFKAAGYDPD
ncbi:hypothetical protein ACFFNA_35120, partial [Mesorhizobium kowhaii]